MKSNDNKKNQIGLFVNTILFGMSLPFGFLIVVVNYCAKIEYGVEGWINVFELILKCLSILIGIGIPMVAFFSLEIKDNIKSQGELFYRALLFGVSVTIGFYIVATSSSQIEFDSKGVTFIQGVLFWMLKWFFILIGIGIPWIIWKKIVEPYKNF